MYNSHLLPGVEYPEPAPLRENEGGCFVGTTVYGIGFTLTPAERDALIARDARNAELIKPYLGGREVNTSPTQTFHRYVIDFGTRSLSEAEAWPDLIAIVRERVKPTRDRDKRDLRLRWWLFGEVSPGLSAALTPLARCLVTTRVTKHLSFSFQPTDRVFSDSLRIFPTEDFTTFAVLQSRAHEVWARLLSSTMRGETLRYSGRDAFQTFPFPPAARMAELEPIGAELHDRRAAHMREGGVGLTKLYNAPPAWLVELHHELDFRVLHAYGWAGLASDPDAVLTELFRLNAERVARAANERQSDAELP